LGIELFSVTVAQAEYPKRSLAGLSASLRHLFAFIREDRSAAGRVYEFPLDPATLAQIWTLGQQPRLLSSDCRIARNTKSSENRSMKTAYVVRELVSMPAGENEFLTHYEYGTFRTYKEANECAIATRNPRCFPQREQFLVAKQEDTFVN
jgi:hypothetical protein